jgi:hypothetical protein
MKITFNDYLKEYFEDQFEVSQQEFGEYCDKVNDDVLHQILHDHTYLMLLQKYTLTINK